MKINVILPDFWHLGVSENEVCPNLWPLKLGATIIHWIFFVFSQFSPKRFRQTQLGVSNTLWFDLTCLENRSISYFYSVNWGIPIAIDLWSGILILQPETLLWNVIEICWKQIVNP